ncbi:ATP-binding protein [Streptomyces lacrimifluminis]|uniref:ATPase n=1 Tax=Streptomyces lacrimifluminis TaxID=1500077 RepID=A0A917LBW0_9ACTN|nr:ATP-binding protein [Streptomyces lacrimifluminis]GGJ53490.1 ATPase [Streptomyces lacrimifluminis]
MQGRALAEERLDPYAEDLIESLRAFGYDLPTALADLVDNSIAAKAKNVHVSFCSDPGEAWVAIVDDGCGMSEPELHAAMRFARNPRHIREQGDLGRFGLGLKTASLSQARMLTVLSINADKLAARTWDIDYIAQRKEWVVLTQPDSEVLRIAERIGFTGQGTAIIWRKTDKLGDGRSLSRKVSDAGRELALTFHRFLETGRLNLRIGRQGITPLDPYLRRHPATQDRGTEELQTAGHAVRVNPVILPHPSRLSKQDTALVSGPGGMLARQGFYVYRGNRLVVAGGWLGLGNLHKSAPTRLARIALEIPPGLDLLWAVDVRKSTVHPPIHLEPRLIELAEDARARSEKIFTYRGAPVRRQGKHSQVEPVWHQVRRLGQSDYSINRDHPLVAAALSSAPENALEGVLRMIETTLPRELIAQEVTTRGEEPPPELEHPDTEEVLATLRSLLTGLPSDATMRTTLAAALLKAEPFCRYPGLVKEIIEIDSTEGT